MNSALLFSIVDITDTTPVFRSCSNIVLKVGTRLSFIKRMEDCYLLTELPSFSMNKTGKTVMKTNTNISHSRY